jgi:hypothetical protein
MSRRQTETLYDKLLSTAETFGQSADISEHTYDEFIQAFRQIVLDDTLPESTRVHCASLCLNLMNFYTHDYEQVISSLLEAFKTLPNENTGGLDMASVIGQNNNDAWMLSLLDCVKKMVEQDVTFVEKAFFIVQRLEVSPNTETAHVDFARHLLRVSSQSSPSIHRFSVMIFRTCIDQFPTLQLTDTDLNYLMVGVSDPDTSAQVIRIIRTNISMHGINGLPMNQVYLLLFQIIQKGPENDYTIDALELLSALAQDHPDVQALRQFVPVLLPCMMYQQVDEESFNRESDNDWTVRKCASECLDHISLIIGEEIGYMIPIDECLRSTSWKTVEVAILALGVIAHAFQDMEHPFIDSNIPVITHAMSVSEPHIQAIACWTVSRYQDAIFQNEERSDKVVQKYIELLEHETPRIVARAASALASISETYSPLPHLEEIHKIARKRLTTARDYLFAVTVDMLLTSIEDLENIQLKRDLAVQALPIVLERFYQDDNANYDFMMGKLDGVAGLLAQLWYDDIDPYAQKLYDHVSEKLAHVFANNRDDLDQLNGLNDIIGSVLLRSKSISPESLTRHVDVVQVAMHTIKQVDTNQKTLGLAMLGDIAGGPVSYILLENRLDSIAQDVFKTLTMGPEVAKNAFYALYELIYRFGGYFRKHIDKIIQVTNQPSEEFLDNIVITLCFAAVLDIDYMITHHEGVLRNMITSACLMNTGQEDTFNLINEQYTMDRVSIAMCTVLCSWKKAREKEIVEQFKAYIVRNYSLATTSMDMLRTFGQALVSMGASRDGVDIIDAAISMGKTNIGQGLLKDRLFTDMVIKS